MARNNELPTYDTNNLDAIIGDESPIIIDTLPQTSSPALRLNNDDHKGVNFELEDEQHLMDEEARMRKSFQNEIVEHYQIIDFKATIVDDLTKGMMAERTSADIDETLFEDNVTMDGVTNEANRIFIEDASIRGLDVEAPLIGGWNNRKVLFKLIGEFTYVGNPTKFINVVSGYSDNFDVAGSNMADKAEFYVSTSQVFKTGPNGIPIPHESVRTISSKEMSALDDMHHENEFGPEIIFNDSQLYRLAGAAGLSNGVPKISSNGSPVAVVDTRIDLGDVASLITNPLNRGTVGADISRSMASSKAISRRSAIPLASIVMKNKQNGIFASEAGIDYDTTKITYMELLTLCGNNQHLLQQIVTKEMYDNMAKELFDGNASEMKSLLGDGDVFDGNKKLHIQSLQILEIAKKALASLSLMEVVFQLVVSNGQVLISCRSYDAVNGAVTKEGLKKVNAKFNMTFQVGLMPYIDEFDGVRAHVRATVSALTTKIIIENVLSDTQNFEHVAIPTLTELTGTGFTDADTAKANVLKLDELVRHTRKIH